MKFCLLVCLLLFTCSVSNRFAGDGRLHDAFLDVDRRRDLVGRRQGHIVQAGALEASGRRRQLLEAGVDLAQLVVDILEHVAASGERRLLQRRGLFGGRLSALLQVGHGLVEQGVGRVQTGAVEDLVRHRRHEIGATETRTVVT